MKLIGELEIMTFVFLVLHMIVQQKNQSATRPENDLKE